MKKLVLLLAVAFSVSMFSCGNGNGKDGKDTADTAKKEAPAPATPRETVQNNKPKVKLIIPKTELANIVKLLMNEGNREIEIECK